MSSAAVLLAAFLLASSLAAQELPPYSPPVDPVLMTSYVNTEVGFTVRYPVEFSAGTQQDLQTVMERGHHAAYGTAPKNDPEHAQALKCMHSLLYATSALPKPPNESEEKHEQETPDTILVVDFDRTCIPKKIKGDKVLTQLAGTILNLPGMKPLVPQTWFVAGGSRHIHSGMAGGFFSAPTTTSQGAASSSAPEVAAYVLAAAFEQKDHLILVAYLNGTYKTEVKHLAFPYTAVSFEDGKPILLFPFLLGKMNLVK